MGFYYEQSIETTKAIVTEIVALKLFHGSKTSCKELIKGVNIG